MDKTDKSDITIDDIYIVWKALVSTTIPDGLYYEVTFIGDKNEAYLNVYKKWENKCISMDDYQNQK